MLVDTELLLVPGDVLFHEDLAFEFRGVGILPIVTRTIDGRSVTIGAARRLGLQCVHGVKNGRCRKCQNVPFHGEEPLTLEGYEHQLADGFRIGLQAIYGAQDEVAGGRSVLLALSDVPGRLVMRSTVVYDAILRWVFAWIAHGRIIPDVKALLRDMPSRLPETVSEVVLSIEEEALLRADIPKFEIAFSDMDVVHEERKIFTFRYSGIERARRRVRSLTPLKCEEVTAAWTEAAYGHGVRRALI